MDDAELDASGHDENADSPQRTSGVPIRRACNPCRTRKIRCDRNSPCSQCLNAKLDCTYAVLRPKEKRSRILLTTQYERKIDIINERLQKVTQLLEDLKADRQTSQPSTNTSESNALRSSTISMPYRQTIPSDSDSPLVEGESSSLAAHSVFANEFLQKAVRTGSLQDSSLEMRETLDALHHIVDSLRRQNGAGEMEYPHAHPAQRPTLRGIKLPPIEKATAMIRGVKKTSFDGASWLHFFIPPERFPDLCMGVYFSDDYSESDFIIVNAGLLFLFWDRVTTTEGEEQHQCRQYADMCQANLETGLASLPLHLPATSDTVVALALGAFHAVELSKPSLGWILTSKASEICQTLGYHRVSTMKNDKPEDQNYKLLLFWAVYFLDKSLSLRLGRASTIPDWDITVPDPIPSDPPESILASQFYIWSITARCQGCIYEQLYSPGSMTERDDVRASRVKALVLELERINAKADETDKNWFNDGKPKVRSDMIQFFILSDSVLRSSLLTLVYRASPAPPGSSATFSRECIDSARTTIRKHQECMISLGQIHPIYFPSYVHWTVLFAPFIPFIVLFCHVIETREQPDLELLHGFITSIQTAPSMSDAAAKMYRLFQVLYSVALRYIEVQNTGPPVGQSQASAELDNYLSALGFPAMGYDNQQQQQSTTYGSNTMVSGIDQSVLGNVNPMMWMGNTAQLDEWFNSNQQMMGLVHGTNFDFLPENM